MRGSNLFVRRFPNTLERQVTYKSLADLYEPAIGDLLAQIDRPMKNRIIIIIGCIILIFILANPSLTDFKEYLKTIEKNIKISKENYNEGIGRSHNFLIFSNYSCRCEINTRMNPSRYHYVNSLEKLYSVADENMDFFLKYIGGKEVNLYKVDSTEYEIPIKRSEDFLKDFPYAKRVYPIKDVDTVWRYKLVDTTLHYIGILKNFIPSN